MGGGEASDLTGRAAFAIERVTGRPARAGEAVRVVKLFVEQLGHYQDDRKAAVAMATKPLGPLPDGMNAAELAAWTVVANVLLNLDETLTKG